uniref:Secreted peptide n=1 Tax=Anopheles braziliensis TaxID=58242 RepID=A0A2M3ZM17_9DIPT
MTVMAVVVLMVARIVRMQMVMMVMVAAARCCRRSSRRQGAQVGHRRHGTGQRRIDQKRGIRSRHMITRDCRRAFSVKNYERTSPGGFWWLGGAQRHKGALFVALFYCDRDGCRNDPPGSRHVV